ncbi:Replication factor C [Natrinema sp. J7-2]|nr:Replication factor C [Natrinema sp. J7-2]
MIDSPPLGLPATRADGDLRSFYLAAPPSTGMSEADAEAAESTPGKTEVWIEKYRPERLNDIKGHTDIVPRLKNYVEQDDLPHLLFAGPAGTGKTTAAKSIAREVYDDDWQENFLELNASDQRGIDVVRDRIKDFARSSFGGYSHRIIFLDEADALTSDAQSALRRTMEQFSNNTRFILSCNYSSQIIDPIQSRCAVFRFTELTADAIEAQVREIAATEDIAVTDDGVDALVYAADGDMRKAINALQAAAVMGETVDEETVFAITATARPEEVEAMVEHAIDGDFTAARAALEDLLTERGLAGGDVIDQLHRSAWEFDVPERATVRLLERLGEVDYRITEGANERLQLEAMLASLALDADA